MYKMLINILKKLYIKMSNKTFARHVLDTCQQKLNKSLNKFLQELHKLSKNCVQNCDSSDTNLQWMHSLMVQLLNYARDYLIIVPWICSLSRLGAEKLRCLYLNANGLCCCYDRNQRNSKENVSRHIAVSFSKGRYKKIYIISLWQLSPVDSRSDPFIC